MFVRGGVDSREAARAYPVWFTTSPARPGRGLIDSGHGFFVRAITERDAD
jgi:hypothetical protein